MSSAAPPVPEALPLIERLDAADPFPSVSVRPCKPLSSAASTTLIVPWPKVRLVRSVLIPFHPVPVPIVSVGLSPPTLKSVPSPK